MKRKTTWNANLDAWQHMKKIQDELTEKKGGDISQNETINTIIIEHKRLQDIQKNIKFSENEKRELYKMLFLIQQSLKDRWGQDVLKETLNDFSNRYEDLKLEDEDNGTR